MLNMRAALCFCCLLMSGVLTACGGSGQQQLNSTDQAAGNPAAAFPVVGQPTGGWPSALPEDFRRPWEQVDSLGLVVPVRHEYFSSAKGMNAIDVDTDFTLGVDREADGGSVSDKDLASSLSSGVTGAGGLSWARYRIPMGSNLPGMINVDVNLLPTTEGMPSCYYVGLSDYGRGTWEWRGPFTDNHVRLPVTYGDYRSPLGSLFVVVAAYDGCAVDVVGVGVNPHMLGDTTPPPAPSALSATPVDGGLHLEWTASAASDLAGYQVYWSYSQFNSAESNGVHAVGYLTGDTEFFLAGLQSHRTAYARVEAVDIHNNHSGLSPQASALAGSGNAAAVVVTTDVISGQRDVVATLTASGADSYDWDLDGDGSYDVTGDTTGVMLADTSAPGFIRPAVRGTKGATGKTRGAVSLIITSQVPPVALVNVSPTKAVLWGGDSVTINVDASASYDDEPGLEYAFDFLGSGNYGAWTSTPTATPSYSRPGLYYISVRVRDSDELIDHDAMLLEVQKVDGFDTDCVATEGQATYTPATAIVGGLPCMSVISSQPGNPGLFFVRATDLSGDTWDPPIPVDTSSSALNYNSITAVDGRPAIAYYDALTDQLRYIIADDTDGQSWTTPRVAVYSPVAIADKVDLEVIDGNPAITYIASNTYILYYTRATTSTGASAADWANLPVPVASAITLAGKPDLEVISGNPAIAYYDSNSLEAEYVRANNSTGALPADWTVSPVVVSGANPVTGYVCLKEVLGRPAVAYRTGAGPGVAYIRALGSTGQSLAQWPAGAVFIDTVDDPGGYLQLAVVNDIPHVAYRAAAGALPGLYLVRSLDHVGTNWEPRRLVWGGPMQDCGVNTTLLEYRDMPVMGHWSPTLSIALFSKPNIE